MVTGDIRGRALSSVVGWSRSYLNQIELARDELAELQQAGHGDLGALLRAVDDAKATVRAVNSIGSELLRRG
jgi:hypothetical protein